MYYFSQLTVANKMADPRFPHCAVEVSVPEKTRKYTRFANEKRAKRTPGIKRVQTPHIMVTKWDVELANKRNKKVGRGRDRAEKYGDWNENRTDTMWEDKVNRKANEAAQQRCSTNTHKMRAERVERSRLASMVEYADLLFPVLYKDNKMRWAPWAWESYYEQKDMYDMDKFEASCTYQEFKQKHDAAWHKILNSPEQLAINAANDAHNATQGPIEGDFVIINLHSDEEDTEYWTDEEDEI